MGILRKDVFTFMVNYEKYYRQKFWKKIKTKNSGSSIFY